MRGHGVSSAHGVSGEQRAWSEWLQDTARPYWAGDHRLASKKKKKKKKKFKKGEHQPLGTGWIGCS